MSRTFDVETVQAAFTLPNSDGSFDPEFHNYLQELGERRPSVILAFPPKAAGTYLRSAVIVAVRGSLVRTVHAQGGRDASFYLPTFLSYYAQHLPASTLVTHVHMQALPANRFFIQALDLKPVVMIRSIPDMLASYLDMLEGGPLSADNWLNIEVPENYASLNNAAKADFIVDMMGPWYASFYASWVSFAAQEPGRVLEVTYDSFLADPASALEKILNHSRLARSREQCEAALKNVWDERTQYRYNKGVAGRGQSRFTAAQIARLVRQIAYYPNLASLQTTLVPQS